MFELQFNIDAALWPACENLLEQFGALAVTQADGDHPVFGEPGLGSAEQWRQFTVVALFDDGDDAGLIGAALKNVCGELAIEQRPVVDQAWNEVWKSRWQPQLFEGGLCICPSWCEPPPTVQHLIRLDPGQAFGTGTHTSTALCLNYLAQRAPLTGLRAIDYGCGSGILALAAARFGAAHVTAVDIDEAALVVAAENVTNNAAQTTITVGAPEILGHGRADLLLANILLEPLLTLAGEFADLIKAGGGIALAGLLTSQVAQVEQAYARDFVFDPAVQNGDWALLAGVRR